MDGILFGSRTRTACRAIADLTGVPETDVTTPEAAALLADFDVRALMSFPHLGPETVMAIASWAEAQGYSMQGVERLRAVREASSRR